MNRGEATLWLFFASTGCGFSALFDAQEHLALHNEMGRLKDHAPLQEVQDGMRGGWVLPSPADNESCCSFVKGAQEKAPGLFKDDRPPWLEDKHLRGGALG
jgi:hypothetical protein